MELVLNKPSVIIQTEIAHRYLAPHHCRQILILLLELVICLLKNYVAIVMLKYTEGYGYA